MSKARVAKIPDCCLTNRSLNNRDKYGNVDASIQAFRRNCIRVESDVDATFESLASFFHTWLCYGQVDLS